MLKIIPFGIDEATLAQAKAVGASLQAFSQRMSKEIGAKRCELEALYGVPMRVRFEPPPESFDDAPCTFTYVIEPDDGRDDDFGYGPARE
jgi:hypothetical protein